MNENQTLNKKLATTSLIIGIVFAIIAIGFAAEYLFNNKTIFHEISFQFYGFFTGNMLNMGSILASIIFLLILLLLLASALIGTIALIKAIKKPELYGGKARAVIGVVLSLSAIFIYLFLTVYEITTHAYEWKRLFKY